MNKALVKGLLIVSLLSIGCGKQEEKRPWPGHIKSISGFSAEEEAKVRKAIAALNEKAGEEMVSETSQDANFTIDISKVSASSWPTSRAGYATVSSAHCQVEISDMLFTDQKAEYLHPVVWHEIGHCSGLPHSKSEGEIMSPTTSVMAAYPTNQIGKFIESIRESAGL